MAVEYTRTTWKNRAVQRPRTYTETTNSDNSVTHTPAPGTVAQEGTPLNEDNLNNIEEGIVRTVAALNEALATIQTIQTTLSSYNTRIGNNERGIRAIQNVDETQSANIASLTQAHNALAEDEEALEGRADGHIARRDNPHQVTKEQIGLGNVPNLSVNDQKPTFTKASSNQGLTSGEKLSTMLGKIAKDLDSLLAHLTNYNDPHNVTKAQVDLGNVPNVTTNNQTPTYSVASSDQQLASGETLATAFGKLKRAVARLYEHIADTDNPHNTGFFETKAVDFISAWGEPAKVGVYTGNGSSAGTIRINNTNYKGQQINLGFAPSKVVIFTASMNSLLGHDEERSNTEVVMIGPGLNYYHSGCGSTYRTADPQMVLGNAHGGAVVYGNSFIVQSYQNQDNDMLMNINTKGVTYNYMAWR